MWQVILAIVIVAITIRIVSAVRYVKSLSGLTIIPHKGLRFWFKGHMDDFLFGKPLTELKYYLIPYMTKIASENDMPVIFTPGPLVIQLATVLMTDPIAIRESHSTQHMHDIHKSPGYKTHAYALLGDGILSNSGDEWHRQRRICDLGFAISIIRSSVEIKKYKKLKNSDGKINITVDVEAALIAADVMGHVIFGHDFNAIKASKPSEAPIFYAFKNVLHIIGVRMYQFNILPSLEFRRNMKIIDKMVDDIIVAEKAKTEKSGTLVSFLLDGDYKGQKLSESEIKYNMKTFMFAGQDTTASALTWSLYFLALYPEVQRKAREEVDKVLGRDRTTPITYEMVKSELVYINNFMKEVLRIRPSAFFAKVTLKDITLPGSDGKSYNIPKGAGLFYNPLFVHLNKKYWGEDATEFKPERWEKLENEKDLSLIYFPFAQGHRSCIGTNFAKAEIVTVVTKLLQSFEFKLTPETERQAPRILAIATMSAESFTLELVERE